MANAIDKREYLMSLNPPLAKEGRGKFSNAAKEALAKAEAEGIVFVDKKSVVSTVATVNENGEIVSERREINIYAPHPDPIREGRLTFAGKGTKMTVSASEACVSCMHSFGWCYCETPMFRYWKTGEVLSLV